MPDARRLTAGLALACAAACASPPPDAAPAAADSTWIRIDRPTIVAFHPLASNAQIDADADLATVLDDLAYHLGTAGDSLDTMGMAVQHQAGDSVKLLLPAQSVWVRPAASAGVGYLFADPRGNRAVVYGVRTYTDLYELAQEFLRTGRIGAR